MRGERGITKRNDKMQLPQKVLCGNIHTYTYIHIARTMRPSGQVEKRKAATATATGLRYMANLNWIGHWNCTWHFIGQSAIRFSTSSTARRGQTTIVENLMPPRGVGMGAYLVRWRLPSWTAISEDLNSFSSLRMAALSFGVSLVHGLSARRS